MPARAGDGVRRLDVHWHDDAPLAEKVRVCQRPPLSGENVGPMPRRLGARKLVRSGSDKVSRGFGRRMGADE